MSKTILEIQGVETFYGHVHALRGISFSVKAGEIVALLGANGAGKSTTLRTISGLNKAAKGTISFMGHDISKMPPHDIVSMGLVHVPEGRRVFKGMTIKENLELGSFTLQDDRERMLRMEHVFELFPVLYERRQRDAALLSGGEQQMLAMGRALMAPTKLLLLDEPSMGLAPTLVQSIMKIIKRLNGEGVTILLVEQNAKAALKLANYGYVLETGSIVVKGDAQELRNDESIIKAYLGE
jgi:branched-chain amino acid transport system ATP-binding protein